MRKNQKISTLAFALLLLLGMSACSDTKKESKSSAPGMKCGAGKCGANMFDGKGALAKKKRNMLSQMRADDPRKECIKKAKTTAEAYDCVRHKETSKMSLKCGTAKCGEGKCGSALEHSKMLKKNPPKKKPAMKCGAGKCGSSM